jgi:hypothetical protein
MLWLMGLLHLHAMVGGGVNLLQFAQHAIDQIIIHRSTTADVEM